MGTDRKGGGTTVRRRTKSVTGQAPATVKKSQESQQSYESNGESPYIGAAAAALNTEMNLEAVRVRAYWLFLARGATHGDDLTDWLNAERELIGARNP